jgi:hypothetical protein
VVVVVNGGGGGVYHSMALFGVSPRGVSVLC